MLRFQLNVLSADCLPSLYVSIPMGPQGSLKKQAGPMTVNMVLYVLTVLRQNQTPRMVANERTS